MSLLVTWSLVLNVSSVGVASNDALPWEWRVVMLFRAEVARDLGIHFRVLAKCLRMSGGDHLHSGTVVGKLKGDRAITLGFVDLMREECVQQDRSRVSFMDRPDPRHLKLRPLHSLFGTNDWVTMHGASVALVQAPTGLGKYLMRSPSRKGFFGRPGWNLVAALLD